MLEGWFDLSSKEITSCYKSRDENPLFVAALYNDFGDCLVLTHNMSADKYWPLLLSKEEINVWLDYGSNEIKTAFLRNLAGKSEHTKWQLVHHEVPVLVRDRRERSIKNVMTLKEFEDHMA